ncbi:hypothetical protein ES703_76180 [subsurface metagenome]
MGLHLLSMESKNVTVQNWLSRLGKGSPRSYAPQFARFMDYVRVNGGAFSEMGPDELVQYQKETDNGTKFDVLDLVQRYIGSKHGRLSSKKTIYAVLRSFFAHNRAELPRDPRFIMRGDVEKVVGKLTTTDIQQMVLSSNKCYRAIFLSMFQGGLDTASLLYWSENGLEDLREQLRGDPDVIKIELPGRRSRRNSAPFYTMIGMDAIKLVKDWMKVRPEGHKQIFLTRAFLDKERGIRAPISSKSLKIYWLSHLEKNGFIERGGDSSKRYGMNLHEMRDVFRSQWEKSSAKGSVAEFMMGHQVDPLEYNKACRDSSWVKKEYKKGLPLLQLMSSGRPYGQVEEDEVDNLRDRVNELEAELGTERMRKVEEAGEISDLKMKVETMIPAFALVQRIFADEAKYEKIRQILE